MIVLEIYFPARRYWAAPWGEQGDAGGVEWPPSPWRLLRALVEVWRGLACEGSVGVDEASARGLIEALASTAPSYVLPATSRVGGGIGRGGEAQLQVSGSPLIVGWPGVSLTAEQRGALGLWVGRMRSLCRAGPWVDGRVLEGWEGEFDAVPASEGEEVGVEREVVRLLLPVMPGTYEGFRRQVIEASEARALAEARFEALTSGRDAERAKLSASQREALGRSVAPTLFEAIEADPGELQRRRWVQPPGSRWQEYARPAVAVAVAPRLWVSRQAVEAPTLARFVVTSAAAPWLTRGLHVAECVHRAMVKKTDGASIFTGRSEGGEPLRHDHQHAHIFCEAQGHFGHITHISIHAPQAFDVDDQRRLEELRAVVWEGQTIQVALVSLGQPSEAGGLNAAAGCSPLFARASVWRSVTPFVPTRHPKRTRAGQPKVDATTGLQAGSAEQDFRRLLALGGHPEPARVVVIEGAEVNGRQVVWSAFEVKRRHGEGRRGPSPPTGFDVRFSEPVQGPLAFGFGRHFGLGLMTAVR